MIICRHSVQLSCATSVHVQATYHAWVPVYVCRQSMLDINFKEASGHNKRSVPEELMFTSGEHTAATAPLVAGRPVLAPLIGIMLCGFPAAAAAPEVASKNSSAVGLVKPA